MTGKKELFLDLETSGFDPVKHSILSIGMVVSSCSLDNYDSFYREVKYDELVIVPDSIEVNGFSFLSQKGRIDPSQADEEAEEFVRKHFHSDNINIIGLNVGTFDFQFITRQMPLLAKYLSYRTVDLNSLMYVLAEKHSRSFKDFKQELTLVANQEVEKLGLGISKHNALYDAIFNLALYSHIKRII